MDNLKAVLSRDRKELNTNGEKWLQIIMTNESAENLLLSHILDDEVDLVVKVADDMSHLTESQTKGSEKREGIVGKILEAGIMSNFPHPYHMNLDPLIKFRFLSLNNSRTGKYSLAEVLHETATQAYSLSVNQERENIRSDLLDLITDLDKAGVITAKGNEIYFPRNGERLEKAFIRKYWDYVEKIGKRTLFDFEAPF